MLPCMNPIPNLMVRQSIQPVLGFLTNTVNNAMPYAQGTDNCMIATKIDYF